MLNEFSFKKKYGQNFLIDKNIINKIVNSIDVLDNSLVVEIGCGDGMLTSELCKKFKFVLGYEIDLDVKDRLFSKINSFSNFKIIFDDFLNRDVVLDIKDFDLDNLYVVSNLPYYITTAIIEKLIVSGLEFKLMIFMVQKEVADRFTAKVGTKEYNSLTVFLNYNYDVKKLFVVNRKCFYPVPNVDSAIVAFTSNNKKYSVDNEDLFFRVVRDCFKFKRKTIKNNLKNYDLDAIERVLLKHGFDLSVRAEQLNIQIFCEIANELAKN